MLKFKVGDRVSTRGAINIVDAKDPELPYHVRGDGWSRWVREDQIELDVPEPLSGLPVITLNQEDIDAAIEGLAAFITSDEQDPWRAAFDDPTDPCGSLADVVYMAYAPAAPATDEECDAAARKAIAFLSLGQLPLGWALVTS